MHQDFRLYTKKMIKMRKFSSMDEKKAVFKLGCLIL